MSGGDLAIRRAEPRDEPAILRLLDRSLAGGPTGQRDPAFFRWKHHDNPFGRSVAFVAESDGEVVGFRTFMRWRFRTGASTVRAVRAVDTATDPDWQGQGIFKRLTLHALGEIRDEVDLVFNTPNGKSLPGYLKMGWQEVGRVPVAVRPVRPARFLRHVAHATRGGGPGTPPPCPLPPAGDVLADHVAVDHLLAQGSTPAGQLVTDRSAAMLSWRYGMVPGLDYRAVTIHDDADLVGLAIGRPRMRGELAEFTLSEILVRRGDRLSARRLLRSVAKFGGDHVMAHLSGGSEAAARAWTTGFVTPPRSAMTLVARPLCTIHPNPLELKSWRLSLGDLEVF